MKREEAFFILIATFILVLAWIVFSILDSAVSSTISKGFSGQLLAIQPKFNTKVIDELKTRQQILPLNVDPVTEASSSVKPVSFAIEDSPVTKQGTSSGVVEEVVIPTTTPALTPTTTESTVPTTTP